MSEITAVSPVTTVLTNNHTSGTADGVLPSSQRSPKCLATENRTACSLGKSQRKEDPRKRFLKASAMERTTDLQEQLALRYC